MNKQVLMVCLATLVISSAAQADPIVFFNVQVDATVVATTSDGAAGFDSQSGSLDASPLSLSTSSLGAIDVATAGAFVGSGLMTTSADVSAANIGNSVATSHFNGSFTNYAPVSLSIDFGNTDAASGSGDASTTLFITLTSNGATLFSNFVQGPWQYSYLPVAGTTSVLDLMLASQASAAFVTAGAGNASAFGLVTIGGNVPVPEAASWLMFSFGLAALGAFRLRARR